MIDVSNTTNNLLSAIVSELFPLYCIHRQRYSSTNWCNLEDLIKQIQLVKDYHTTKNILRQPEYYGFTTDKKRLYSCGIRTVINISDVKPEDTTIIGSSYLKTDRETFDNDPYETAGGYRKHLAKAGTKATIHLMKNGIHIKYEASTVVDHYNNNIDGMSTDGGTSEYAYGEKNVTRTEKLKSNNIKSELFDGNTILDDNIIFYNY